jgi:hypothetical protein
MARWVSATKETGATYFSLRECRIERILRGFSPHIEHRNYRYDSRFNRVENRKITAADNRPAKLLITPWKHFRVPTNPENRFPKSLMKFIRTFELPGLVKASRVAKVVFDKFKELDGKAPHFRLSRRSSSAREIRLVVPA